MADVRSYFQGIDLDSGAGSDLVLAVNLRLTANGGSIEALGQQAMASSIPVVIASDQGNLAVSQATASALNAEVQGDAAHDAAVSGNPVLNGAYASAAAPTDVSADGDAVRLWALRSGALVVQLSTGGALLQGDTTNGLEVDVTRVSGTVTVDTELPAAGALADATANPTVPAVGAFLMAYDGSDWDRVRLSGSNGSLNVAVTNTVTVDTELPAAAALADATANPTVPGVGGFLMGYNGTTWDRLRTANTGRLQVDVITGGGSDSPTNPVNDYVTSAALAAGSEVNLDMADIGAKKLSQVEVWSSVAYRARVFKVENSVEASEPMAIGGGQPFTGWTWKPPHRNYTTLTSSGGTDTFRVEVTNLDDAQAADVYATFHYED